MHTLNRAIISNNVLHIYTCVIRGQRNNIYIYIYIHTNIHKLTPQTPPSLKSPPTAPRGAVGTPLRNTAIGYTYRYSILSTENNMAEKIYGIWLHLC